MLPFTVHTSRNASPHVSPHVSNGVAIRFPVALYDRQGTWTLRLDSTPISPRPYTGGPWTFTFQAR